jgi:flavin reductase (DIM6/NTAB) family NADH-FMN oxidoreductase RutF
MMRAIMKLSIGARTVICPTPVFVVGTYDKAGKANMMTASWGGIICPEPPCVAISVRKATYSHDSILSRKAFTLSIPSEQYVSQADYFGLVSGRVVDKLAAAKLTAVRSKVVDAPFVKEFPLVLECKLTHSADLYKFTQFVGEVVDVKADESVIGKGGGVDVTKLKPLMFNPDSQEYYGLGKFVAKVFSAGKEV